MKRNSFVDISDNTKELKDLTCLAFAHIHSHSHYFFCILTCLFIKQEHQVIFVCGMKSLETWNVDVNVSINTNIKMTTFSYIISVIESNLINFWYFRRILLCFSVITHMTMILFRFTKISLFKKGIVTSHLIPS